MKVIEDYITTESNENYSITQVTYTNKEIFPSGKKFGRRFKYTYATDKVQYATLSNDLWTPLLKSPSMTGLWEMLVAQKLTKDGLPLNGGAWGETHSVQVLKSGKEWCLTGPTEAAKVWFRVSDEPNALEHLNSDGYYTGILWRNTSINSYAMFSSNSSVAILWNSFRKFLDSHPLYQPAFAGKSPSAESLPTPSSYSKGGFTLGSVVSLGGATLYTGDIALTSNINAGMLTANSVITVPENSVSVEIPAGRSLIVTAQDKPITVLLEKDQPHTII